MATEASASTPFVQAFSCMLRSCISQNIGHLLRIIPPEMTATLTRATDESLARATCALMGVEEVPDLQRNLLTIPANQGWWGLPALETIKACAFIGGISATPKIKEWQIPEEYP